MPCQDADSLKTAMAKNSTCLVLGVDRTMLSFKSFPPLCSSFGTSEKQPSPKGCHPALGIPSVCSHGAWAELCGVMDQLLGYSTFPLLPSDSAGSAKRAMENARFTFWMVQTVHGTTPLCPLEWSHGTAGFGVHTPTPCGLLFCVLQRGAASSWDVGLCPWLRCDGDRTRQKWWEAAEKEPAGWSLWVGFISVNCGCLNMGHPVNSSSWGSLQTQQGDIRDCRGWLVLP